MMQQEERPGEDEGERRCLQEREFPVVAQNREVGMDSRHA
jgi:hypothetical protein